MKYPTKIIIIVGLLLYSSLNIAEALRFAVHPYLTSIKLMDRFTPLAAYLSAQINQPVETTISKNYEHHIERIINHEVDIAYIGPAAYVELTTARRESPRL